MSIKMNKARFISNNSNVEIDVITSSENGDLKCRYCEARVLYVSAYPRETKTGTTYVPAYLRLKSNEFHRPDCQYDTDRLIEMIVANSKDIEKESSIFSTNERGQYSFRLHMLLKAINATFTNERADNDLGKENGLVAKTYTRSSQILSSYIKSAAGIAKLKAIIDGDDEKKLENSIQLIFDGKNISWNDFFYDTKNYAKVVKNILNTETDYHPIAICITIKNEIKENEKKKYKYSLQCFTGDKTSINSVKQIEVPWVITADKEIATLFKVNGNYLIIVKPFANKVTNKDDDKIEFINLYLPIIHKEQIKYLGMAK